MLDDRVRAVLARLEAEDAPYQVAPTTGRFLFALVAPQTASEVLEVGASRGYSSVWLAAGVRHLGGRVVSIEQDPAMCEEWRRNVVEAGLEEWADLVEGDALATLERIEDIFDVVFIDAEQEDYERLFRLARALVESGGLVVTNGAAGTYSRARQEDPTLESVTVPLDRGLELSVVLE